MAVQLFEKHILIKDLTEKIADGKQYIRIAVKCRQENEELLEALLKWSDSSK